jgi:hypothetical protein
VNASDLKTFVKLIGKVNIEILHSFNYIVI